MLGSVTVDVTTGCATGIGKCGTGFSDFRPSGFGSFGISGAVLLMAGVIVSFDAAKAGIGTGGIGIGSMPPVGPRLI